MASIQVQGLHFTYPGSYAPVFSDVSFTMDTDWRLGLVGRNGRGKTTLIRLLAGELQGRGSILSGSIQFDRFPFEAGEGGTALDVLRDAVAPFARWEGEMARLLALGDTDSLRQWGEIEHRYSAQDGYVIDSLIEREAGLMGIEAAQLARPFDSFSPGERTRLLLSALFLRKNRFLLIDEPTNHLDMQGRDIVAQYLAGKRGFLLVSHDRAFLDRSVDHILARQKNSVRVEQGNYSTYRRNKQQQDDHERNQNERLQKDIRRLTESGREKAQWSDRVEATKIGQGVSDRGFVGAASARMMKRSLAIQQRIDRRIEEKESLLKELERADPIHLQPLLHPARVLLTVRSMHFAYPDGPALIQGLSLTVAQGQRLALTGGNGAGKSTLLKLLAGQLTPQAGGISRPQDLVISTLPQETGSLVGTPRALAGQWGLPTDHFFTLLRKFDFPREAFERDARGFSLGQQKKLLLAASMALPAHLYLWDEPLNYIDLESREQIEDMLTDTQATMVFVEHDRHFVEQVATDVLAL